MFVLTLFLHLFLLCSALLYSFFLTFPSHTLFYYYYYFASLFSILFSLPLVLSFSPTLFSLLLILFFHSSFSSSLSFHFHFSYYLFLTFLFFFLLFSHQQPKLPSDSIVSVGSAGENNANTSTNNGNINNTNNDCYNNYNNHFPILEESRLRVILMGQEYSNNQVNLSILRNTS